jgi:hypothetical protein
MPQIETNRLLFIGLGDIGVNAVFEAKRRLALARAPVGEHYLESERLARNPHHFLLMPPGEPSIDNLMAAIHHPSADGWDETLFDSEQELCTPDNFLPVFEQSITRLSSLDTAEFLDRTHISATEYSPTVLVVVDRDTLSAPETQEIIKKITNPPLTCTAMYRGRTRRYDVSLIVAAPRLASSRDSLGLYMEAITSLFLIGQESETILDHPDDFVDLAANACYAFAQLPASHGHHLLEESKFGNVYSIGAAHYHFTGAELDELATLLSLADQKYGHESGYGRRFRHIFIGRFETIDLQKQAAKDDIRPLADWLEDDVAPIMQTHTPGRADALVEEEKNWIERSMGNIREKLNRAALSKRVRALTDFDESLRNAYLESWPERLDTLDFLMRYEIRSAAEENAKKALHEYLTDWRTRMERLFNKAYRSTNEDGYFVAEHPGEVVLRVGQVIDNTITDSLLLSVENVEYDIQHVAAAPKTREDVDAAANRVPHIVSVLLRVALFVLFVLLLWPGVHDLLASLWPDGFGLVGPWVTGGVFGAAGALFILRFMLISRVKDLEETTRSYLMGRREAWEKELAKTEEQLVTHFLEGCKEAVCKAWKPGRRFFQLLTDKKLDSTAKIMETYGRASKVTETYYLNRMTLYANLQNALKKWDITAHCGNLAQQTPPIDDGVFLSDADRFAEEQKDYKPLIVAKNVLTQMESMDLWNTILDDSLEDAEKTKVDRLSSLLIRERTRQISSLRKKNNKWKGLAAWFEDNKVHIDAPESNLMVKKARVTFQLPSPPHPQVSILTQLAEHFNPELSSKFEHIPDRDGLLYLTFQGPVAFENIDWIEES